jgi:alkyl hydroperoxide reductase subunit AhpC
VKVLALSVDPVDSHERWIADINETQKTTVNFPLLADHDRKVAVLYDMIHPKLQKKKRSESVFIIGPIRKSN